MPAMRRYTLDEFIQQLKAQGCEDFHGYVNSDASGTFLVHPNKGLIQIPDVDEEGYIPGWQLDEILRNSGLNVYFVRPREDSDE